MDTAYKETFHCNECGQATRHQAHFSKEFCDDHDYASQGIRFWENYVLCECAGCGSRTVLAALPGLLAAFTIWLASAAIVEAQVAPALRGDRAFSSGLALGAAAGSEAPMFGGVALYYLQLADPRLRVALHVGAGGVPRVFVTRAWGLAAGAFLAYGKHNRLVAGVSAGTQTWERLTWYGTQLASRPLWGAGLAVGYEWMSSFGLFLRTSVGPSFYVRSEQPLIRRKVYPSFQLGLTLGYKLW